MKKRILIATSLLVILIIGSISVYATSFESNIDIMEKVGQLFKSHKEKSDNSIFAKGKSGGIITKDDIEQATEFYILAGYTESTAREKAIKYMLELSLIHIFKSYLLNFSFSPFYYAKEKS